MKKLITLLALLFIGLLAGCATIVSGTSQELSFISSPEGATVTVNGKVLGKAPLTVSLKKEAGQSLTFEKEGYKPLTMRLDTRINSWFWGNIVIGGLLGSTTDGISGGVYEYSPAQYMVTLDPIGTSHLEGPIAKSEAQKAKEFIVIGYANILNNLRAGQGPYLSSLLTMLKIRQENRDEATKKIRALSEAYTEIPEFADHVVNLYIKQP